MSGSRVDALRSLLEKRPGDARLRFGLAVEYLNAGEVAHGVRELRTYLASHEDEGNGWGRLAEALLELGEEDEARDAYRRAIEVAERHDHPTMAEGFREALAELG
jgi:predicted Zn-dependent protease